MASALEQFVNNVRALSTQGHFHELSDLLSKSTDVLVKNAPHLDNVLETLDLEQHSLGVLAVLCVKLSLPNREPPTPDHHELLFAQIQEFIAGCNGEQVRFSPDTYSELCHLLTHNLVELKVPIRGIDLLQKAIVKIQLTDCQLTAVHADLLQLCLLAKCFKPALKFLDKDITRISGDGQHFDSKYFLLYYYYGGMIYVAMKNYSRALYFLEVAITTPALAVSHIMLEAYKKYILVSLILHGKVLSIPKYTSQIVGRFIKPLSQAYHDFANVYATSNPDDLRVTITKYQETFSRDVNLGLTRQVLASLYKKNIQRLTKTFLTLSLSDVASRVQLSGPAEAEKYIVNMIEDGEIFATINQKDGMVVFHDDPEKYNSPGMLRKLEEQMAVCTSLDRKMQQMEEDILVNPVYVKKSCSCQDDDVTSAATTAAGQGSKVYSM